MDGSGVNLALMNTLGQVLCEQWVKGQGIIKTSLSLSGLNPGVYILVIQGIRWKEVRRIIVR